MQDLILLGIFQAFWSSSYVAMKLALAEMPLGLVMILRYSIACIVLAACGGCRGWHFSRRDFVVIAAVGLLVFSCSPYFQLRALQLTFATDVAVLIAFEPMITTLLAVLILKERLQWPTVFTFLAATVGVLIMSDLHGSASSLGAARLFGNAIFFVSLLMEGLYSVTSRHTTQRSNPLHVITLMTLAGAVGNLAMHGHTISLEHLSAIGPSGWGAMLFLSIGCSVIGYGGWTYLTKRIPIKWITLSLFAQPIIGGIVAYCVLDEVPTARTCIGAGVIFGTLILWTLWHFSAQLRGPCEAQANVIAN